jgi:BlaI family transcriptional regulator, penicillinase repressor
MFAKTPDPLSNGEWKVMKIIWEHKSCAARDVYQRAGSEYGWAPTTVKTMLRRLVAKGYLTTTQVGNSFLYRPVRPAMKALMGAADTLLENALDGTLGPLLAHMVKRGNLSAAELAELKDLLDKASAEGEVGHDDG